MDHVLRNLDNMKYSELQKIAKSVGIKANVKIDKLHKALREYYTQSSGANESKPVKTSQDASCDSKSSEDETETKKPAKRVTKKARRRGGRRKGSKKEDEEEMSAESQAAEEDKQSSEKAESRKGTPVIVKPVTPQRTSLQQGKSTPMTPQMRALMNLKQTKTPLSQKRKRSGSIPRPVPQSGSKPSTPVAEPSNKRLRRSTFEKTEDMKLSSPKSEKAPSPGVQAMIGAMKSDMSSAEMKATLLKALDEKVQKVKGDTPTRMAEKTVSSTHIPRFAAFLAKKKEAGQKKPITPGNKDWTQVHQKEFDKFDSIDVYLQKKRERTKSITKSVTKISQIIEESQKAVTSLKNLNTPTPANNENRPNPKPKHDTKANLFKSPSRPTPFKPSVFKTKNMNTNFGAKPTSTTFGAKIPANQGPVKKATPKAVNTVEKKIDRKSLGSMSARKSTGVTPFKFTATLNTTMPDMKSAKKPVFDLKASLARPVTWKAHKGKLKPMGDSAYAGPAAVSVKTPQTVSREDRRAAIANHRANKKHQSQMQRRGIHA